MMINTALRMSVISISVLVSSSGCATEPVKAHQPLGSAKEPSVETRQQMAFAHQKMADCLKSTRPLMDCRSEMRVTCKKMATGSGENCPMMDEAGPMKGHGHGMRGPTESDGKNKR